MVISIKKPIIGITYRTMLDEYNRSVDFVVEGILEAVKEACGIPFLILDNDISILDLCDGFILPGGDNWYLLDEIVIKYAINKDKPLLGICLGMQTIGKILSNNSNILGDTTIKNNTDIEHSQLGVDFVHEVIIRDNTKLFDIIGESKIKVNSRHNFHIEDIDSKYVSAVSTDGIIEAIELLDKKFIIGIQWHPEDLIYKDDNSIKIFKSFICSTLK